MPSGLRRAALGALLLAAGGCQAPPPPAPIAAAPATTAPAGQSRLWADTGIAARNEGGKNCPPMSWDIAGSYIGATIGLRGVIWFTDGSGTSSARGAAGPDGSFDMTVRPISGNGPRGQVRGRRYPDGSIEVHMNGTGCSHLDTVLPPGATRT